MGTVVRITIYAANDSAIKPAFARIAPNTFHGLHVNRAHREN